MYSKEKIMKSTSQINIVKYVLVITIGLLISCSKKSGDEKSSQSIVRINGDEITMYQLNNELRRINPKADQLDDTSMQVTSALIDRQILIQEAKKNDIDRKPRVVQAIEGAKMQIISQSYLEDKIALKAKPNAAEVSDYRSQHADIFNQRKIFTIDEVSFKVENNYVHEIPLLINSAKSIEDVVYWLNSHQSKYTQNHSEHASETIPPLLLAKLEKMKIGDLFFTTTKDITSVLRLISIENASISEIDSKPIIEQILFNQKRAEIIDSEMKRLHSLAKIEYLNKKFEPKTLLLSRKDEVKSVKSVIAVVKVDTRDGFEKGLSSLK